MTRFRVGSKVEWNCGKGTAIKRDADAENPAYLIEQDDGGRVLKSHSELRRAK